MPLIFRSMYAESGAPKLGTTRCCLGVRPGTDIKPDTAGIVHPQRGKGLSICPSIEDLPPLLIPERLKELYPDAAGENLLCVWRFGSGPFAEEVLSPVHPTLKVRPDKPGHGTVGPDSAMPLASFQLALAATLPAWELAEKGESTDGHSDIS